MTSLSPDSPFSRRHGRGSGVRRGAGHLECPQPCRVYRGLRAHGL